MENLTYKRYFYSYFCNTQNTQDILLAYWTIGRLIKLTNKMLIAHNRALITTRNQLISNKMNETGRHHAKWNQLYLERWVLHGLYYNVNEKKSSQLKSWWCISMDWVHENGPEIEEECINITNFSHMHIYLSQNYINIFNAKLKYFKYDLVILEEGMKKWTVLIWAVLMRRLRK